MARSLARLLPAGLLLLAGCDLLDTKYESGDLPHVLKGQVPSPTDRYRISMPDFAAIAKHTAIARDGTVFAVVVGPNLREVLESIPPGAELGVHLVKADRRYLVVEKVYTDDGEIDLFEGVEKFRFRRPKLVGHDEIPQEKFDHDARLCEVAPRSRSLDAMAGKKVYLSEFDVTRHELDPVLVDRVSAPTGRPEAYVLTSAGSDWVVADPDPMTRLILDFLIAEGREFQGGVRIVDVFERKVRGDTRVAGTVDVKWISLGGTLFYRAV